MENDMKTFKEEKIMVIDEVFCDNCGEEIISISECLSIDHQFGYFSKGLDGTKIKLEICEKCIPELLGSILFEKGKRQADE
jgi:hypothetical protein